MTPALVSTALLLVPLVGCSKESAKKADTPATVLKQETVDGTTTTAASDTTAPGGAAALVEWKGDPNSPYCKNALIYRAALLTTQGDSVADVQASSAAAVTYAKANVAVVPPEIKDQFGRLAKLLDQLDGQLQVSGWDYDKLQTAATDPIKALVNGTDPDQEDVLAYETDVCITGDPPTVESMQGQDAGLCSDMASLNDARAAIDEQDFTPDLLHRLADAWTAAAGSKATGGPAGLADDLRTSSAWLRDHAVPVMSANGWDMAKILTSATAEQRAAVAGWDPAVRDKVARLESYRLEVCAAPSGSDG